MVTSRGWNWEHEERQHLAKVRNEVAHGHRVNSLVAWTLSEGWSRVKRDAYAGDAFRGCTTLANGSETHCNISSGEIHGAR